MNSTAGWLTLLGFLLPSLTSAQTWTTTLSGTPAQPIVGGSLTQDSTKKVPYSKEGATWTINCTGSIVCSALRVVLYEMGSAPNAVDSGRPAKLGLATAGSVKYAVTGRRAESTLVLFLDSTATARRLLTVSLLQEEAKTTDRTALITIDPACSRDIPVKPASHRDTTFVHRFLVDYLGNVLVRPQFPVDDRSRVLVTVIARKEALTQLRISRSSAFRSVGTINLLGGGVDLSGINLQSAGEEMVEVGCRTVELGDFASGKGEVEIALVSDKGVSEKLGTFDFAVNPTYTGALSFGAIRTPLLDPEIGLAFTGSDTVITAKTDGIPGRDSKAHRILYTVSYTYYMWGRRDIEKPRPLLERFNPMIGVVLNDIPNNFIAGVAFDLFDGVFISGGAHAGKVRALDPESGLEFGNHFGADAKELPVRRSWRTRWFVGASIDLNAASQLFKSILGAGK